jgi:hypothetical protein
MAPHQVARRANGIDIAWAWSFSPSLSVADDLLHRVHLTGINHLHRS